MGAAHTSIFRAMGRSIFLECFDYRQRHHPWDALQSPQVMIMRNVQGNLKSSFHFIIITSCLCVNMSDLTCFESTEQTLLQGDDLSFSPWTGQRIQISISVILAGFSTFVIEVTYCHKNIFDSHG